MNIQKYIKETIKYALRNKYVIRKYINEVEKMYAMTSSELNLRNESLFLENFRRAYDKSPFYFKLYSGAGVSKDDIKCLADIKKLPVITKEDVIKYADEMLTVQRWKVITNYTSGTTGSPLKVYEDWPSIWREQAYFYCYRKRCGYIYGQPIVSLRGNLDKKDTYLKIHLSNTLYLSSYNINDKTIAIYYEQILKHKPRAIEGYPSSLYALALLMRNNNLFVHIPITFTSSETLLDYQRDLIEKQFKTEIYDHFGTTERTIRLSESFDHTGYFEDPGYSINEYTVDGEITTSLINMSFPLIRYKGNDIMEQSDLSGTGKIKINKIKGRQSAFLEGKDGTRYSGALMTRVFKDITSIENAQFIQYEKGKVNLNIVINGNFTDADMLKLRKSVEEQLGKENFVISIELITSDKLIYTSGGKFNYVLNLIKDI